MHYKGRELISRPSRASGRTLLVSAFAFILIIANGGIDEQQITVLSLTLKADTVRVGGSVLLAYLIIAHFINVRGDILSFFKWNNPKQILGSEVTIGLGSKLTTELEDAISSLDKLVDKIANSDQGGLSASDSEKLNKVLSELEDISDGHKALAGFAERAMIGWFTLVPIGMGVLSLILVFKCLE